MAKIEMIPFSKVDSFNCDTIKKSWWRHYAKHESLSMEDMEKYADYFDWTILCGNQYMTEDFIRKFDNRVNFATLLSHKSLSEKLIEDYCWSFEYTEWKNVWEYQKMSIEFIEKHIDHADWYFIPRNQRLTIEFWDKYWDKMDHEIFFKKIRLKEDQIRFYLDKAIKEKPEYEEHYWGMVCEHQKLSESFLREFHDKVNWWHLSENKKKLHLSNNFRREMIAAGHKLYGLYYTNHWE